MLETLFGTENLLALLTLTGMEIVLGIDNIIFIAILVSRLPKADHFKARTLGLGLALVLRIALLFSLSWLMGLTEPMITLFEHGFSGRDLILLGGGLFLVAKSTIEIHHKVERADEESSLTKTDKRTRNTFLSVISQIMVVDVVFSLDSVITAVGMVQNVGIMVTAVVISMLVMIAVSGKISEFVEKHPTIKILALAFLIMIGVMLIAEGMGVHVSKGYIYFAMAFSLSIEMLNMRYQKKRKKISQN